MLSNYWFGRRRFLKVFFLLLLPWQPEFLIEHNYLKEFERGPRKRNIPVKFRKNPVYSF